MRLQPSKHSHWNPFKRWSNKQKAHLASLNSNLQGSDENSNPTTGSTSLPHSKKSLRDSGHCPDQIFLDQLNVIEERASTYKRQYRNERKKCIRREKTVESLKEQCSVLAASCSSSLSQLEKLEIRHTAISKKNHTLTMRWKRASTTAKRAVTKAKEVLATKPPTAFELKDRGTITDASRSMVHDLVASLDVPISSVNGVIQTVATTLGVDVKGSTSSRSIRCIIGEAGVAAEAQLVDEISQTEGMSLTIPPA